ncbi:MAG TPA: hypothetical protein VI541_01780 [Actinomycetota bacterium]|nr:hypothetical protein [Actinomycetota bacterium]
MRTLKVLLGIGLSMATLIGATLPAQAADTYRVGRALINLGHPATFAYSVTEFDFYVENRCAGVPKTQGVDGWVLSIDSLVDRYIVSTAASDHGVGLGFGVPSNYAFYSADCGFVGPARNIEQGQPVPIPTNPQGVVLASWVVVSFPYGAPIYLDWKICTNLNPATRCYF